MECVFCRVIDNLGDVGVCWRLACNLAARGEDVCLWLDDASALTWMAPHGAPRVKVLHWTHANVDTPSGDVVIEAFGCELPQAFVQGMARRQRPAVWINLEYLSAEGYVERSHGLPSPQFSGAGLSLKKWFFFPGFTAATGGLLRESDLMQRRAAFDGPAWLRRQGLSRQINERVVSVFCYPNAPVAALLRALSDQPTLVLLTPGAAQDDGLVTSIDGGTHLVRTAALPWLEQTEFDHLLWACDINFVRGEDSWVRAMWAGAPFVWNIYPQHDGAHAAKLDAFLTSFGANAVPQLTELMRTWNGLHAGPISLPDISLWREACGRWRDSLIAQDDLSSQLMAFAQRSEEQN